jgi:Hint domain
MNQLVIENAALANFGPFDPNDAQSGDVLFLDSNLNMFATLDGIVTAPAPPAATVALDAHPLRAEQEIHRAIGPALAADNILVTDKGEVAAHDLRPGQRILTRDKGFQTVLWVARRDVTAAEMAAEPDLRPVKISAGALGPNLPSSDLLVPGCQRVMVEGPLTKLMFGVREVFVPVQHLVGYPGITHGELAETTYVHALCRAHEVIWADGVWTESFQPTSGALECLTPAQYTDITEVLPPAIAVQSARMTLKRHEADLLLA